jgi:putative addiction module component (TIGR02574 family)
MSDVNPSVETIASEALLLPNDQRLVLAHRILSSVEPVPDAEVEAAWDAEIQERVRRYDAGLTHGVPGLQVFAELDKKLKR